jgi:hypothetical protein
MEGKCRVSLAVRDSSESSIENKRERRERDTLLSSQSEKYVAHKKKVIFFSSLSLHGPFM